MEAVLDVEALRANIRIDGRQKDALRELTMEKETTYRADGSSTILQGNTQIVTSVFGPKKCSTTNAEFSDKAKIVVKISYSNDRDDSELLEMEYVIQKLLENVINRSLFPRTSINVYIQVVCDDGSILAAIINSVILAIQDSELPILNSFAAVCLLVTAKGEILPDPCKDEEERNRTAICTIVYDKNCDIMNFCSCGRIEDSLMMTLVDNGKQYTKRIFYLMNHERLV